MLATIYDSPIYQAIYALMDSVPFVYVNAIGCIVLIIVFALYAFSREGRDEHGRAIIGSACLWGLLALFILMNLLANSPGPSSPAPMCSRTPIASSSTSI